MSEVVNPYCSPCYPGTSIPVTHSYDERIEDLAEFDDALLDQQWWKNPRYDGCKLTAKTINEYNAGDSSFQNLPVLTNKTTALYIANTVVGGTEDDQFATIKFHSYVGVHKIVLINTVDDTVQVLDKASEGFHEFHRFITNDLPTGARCTVKLLDESVSNNLQGNHRVKMNKGYLLKSLSFIHGGDVSASAANQNTGATSADFLLENNSLYFYRSGSFKNDVVISDGSSVSVTATPHNNQLRFRYGMIEGFEGTAGKGSMFSPGRMGPSYA